MLLSRSHFWIHDEYCALLHAEGMRATKQEAAYCLEYWGVERAEGTMHLLSGWLVFVASLAVIFLLHRLVRALWLGPGEPAVQEEYA